MGPAGSSPPRTPRGIRGALGAAAGDVPRARELTVLPVDMQLYRRGSAKVMEALRSSATRSRSSGSTRPTSTWRRPRCRSRGRGRSRPGSGRDPLVCSIGLGPNKLMAKIASDLDKPDGLFVLSERNWLEAVGQQPASLLPGVGPETFEQLRRGHRDRGRPRRRGRGGPGRSASGRATAPCGSSETASAPPRSRPSASASPRAARPPSPMTSATRTRWRRR